MKVRRCAGNMGLVGVVAATVALTAGSAWSQESNPETARATMRGMFVVLSSVYAYSLDADAFADPRNRTEILSKLEALATNADQMEAHGAGLDPSFDFMRRSLSRDAHEAFTDFKIKNYVGSRFLVNMIPENCVTCHTKLPAERQFEAGHEFLESVDLENFPAPARANLEVATRQFSDAMKTYEKVMGSPEETAEDLATFHVFENYLRISIGPMNDTKRPMPTLTKFLGRADMPDALKGDVRAWIASLETLKLDVPTGEELPAARRMVATATEKTTSKSDRAHLVDFIGSITLVHRYLRSNPGNDTDLAEAYYLLGVAESHVSRSYWVSDTEYLLEKSIRQAPKSAVAKEALAYLEDYRRSSHDVTPARAVPPDMQTNIDELRKLVGQ